MHLNVACSLYEEQVKAGRFFIHEHPALATSWEEPAVKCVKKLANVQVSRVDACQYGMTGTYHGEDLPVKKPTRWMTNMQGSQKFSTVCAAEGTVFAQMDGNMQLARGNGQRRPQFTR